MVQIAHHHAGSALRALRVDAGLSLRALAKRIGVSSAYLSRVENGHDPTPTPARLVAMAKALGVPAALLLELGHQTGPALAAYLDDVPAAHGFFLEVASRDLDANQLGRLRAFMNSEFGPITGQPAVSDPLAELVADRMVLGAHCTSLEEVIRVAADQLADEPRHAAELSDLILQREESSPTRLGGGIQVPHTLIDSARESRAVLVTLKTPLPDHSPDGIAVKVVLVIVSPAQGREHLLALAQVARLACHDLVGRLHAANSPGEVRALFGELEPSG